MANLQVSFDAPILLSGESKPEHLMTAVKLARTTCPGESSASE